MAFKRIQKRRLENSISTKDLKRLLVSHNFLVAGRIFFEIFLNVFIWKQTDSIIAVAWFNIVYLLVHTIIFSLFTDKVKRGHVHFPRQLGLAGFGFVYLAIYFLADKVINYLIPLAIVIGIFNGLYWISYQTIRFDLTHTKNRGNYAGMEGATRIVVKIIMPALGGFLITANFFGWGYATIFLFGALLFFASFFIGNVKYEPHTKTRLHFRKSLKIILKDKDIMKNMWAYFFSNVGRSGALERILLPFLIFSILQNEFELGGWLSFFSVIAIITTLIIGKYMRYKRYNKSIMISTILYAALILSLAFFPSFTIYILFGILVEVLTPFIAIPKRVYGENLVHTMKNYKEHRMEYFIVREWFNVGFGRLFSYVLLLFIGGIAPEQLMFILPVMAGAIIIEAILLVSIKMDLSKI